MNYPINYLLEAPAEPYINMKETANIILAEADISAEAMTVASNIPTFSLDSMSDSIDLVEDIRSSLINSNSQVFYNETYKQTLDDLKNYYEAWKTMVVMLQGDDFNFKCIRYNAKLTHWKAVAMEYITNPPQPANDNPAGNQQPANDVPASEQHHGGDQVMV